MTRRRTPSGVPGEEPEPTRLAAALAAVSDELGLADPHVVGTLVNRWPEVVGEAIAGQARLRSLRGDVLTIAVDSGAWATQLRYLQADLLEQIAGMVGRDVVREVRVVVEPR